MPIAKTPITINQSCMPDKIEFRRKLSEREITRLDECDVQKIERVNDALARSEQAESNKESQKKLRILFERARKL